MYEYVGGSTSFILFLIIGGYGLKKFDNLLDLNIYVNEQKRLKVEENKKQKDEWRHDYQVAVFGGLAGALAGLGTSVIFWLLTR